MVPDVVYLTHIGHWCFGAVPDLGDFPLGNMRIRLLGLY